MTRFEDIGEWVYQKTYYQNYFKKLGAAPKRRHSVKVKNAKPVFGSLHRFSEACYRARLKKIKETKRKTDANHLTTFWSR